MNQAEHQINLFFPTKLSTKPKIFSKRQHLVASLNEHQAYSFSQSIELEQYTNIKVSFKLNQNLTDHSQVPGLRWKKNII